LSSIIGPESLEAVTAVADASSTDPWKLYLYAIMCVPCNKRKVAAKVRKIFGLCRD